MTRHHHTHTFTLAEALAALLLAAIVLPVAVRGVLTAGRAAHVARKTEMGSRLAANWLRELVVTGEWQSSDTNGDFGDEWPEYAWELSVDEWEEDDELDSTMTLLTVSVFFSVQGRDTSTSVSTLEVLTE